MIDLLAGSVPWDGGDGPLQPCLILDGLPIVKKELSEGFWLDRAGGLWWYMEVNRRWTHRPLKESDTSQQKMDWWNQYHTKKNWCRAKTPVKGYFGAIEPT